ncbi:guanine nucleotide-binding protein G(f) subunit alpha [Hetaerina americana]|uniref:guanine nucleotide-binding protein G(f) subunit alpha n=1 Tax=Hetaerina americana TaxID=62018 RepID=UPI003A7F3716
MKLDCFTSEDPARRTSKELEKQIASWNKEDRKAIKILLLGAGEAGKTTIIKQMKILHISGFTDSERREKIKEVRSNIHESISCLCMNITQLQPPIPLESEDNWEGVKFILEGPASSLFTKEYFVWVEKLWKDRGIQECYMHSNEFQLIDSAKYFLDRLRIVQRDEYIPSDQDILYCRHTTTTIQKVVFNVAVPRSFGGGTQEFWMFDVGGQRGQRRKWIQVFEGIHAILFLVASSSYDQTLREARTKNRLEEAVSLFDDVWNSRFLIDSGFIIFLNKQDVLEQKVNQGKSIGKYFPDYRKYTVAKRDGNPDNEYIKTRCFIRDLFIDVTKKGRRQTDRKWSLGPGITVTAEEGKVQREIYTHFTVATNTSNIRTVFDDVHSMVIQWNLEKYGLQ